MYLQRNKRYYWQTEVEMDGIELARQIASDLHTQAVSRGGDPKQPYAFAVAEVVRRDMDVESTAPGATILNGGRATFIPGDALILHENIGTPFEQACLIAHEIGHVELGDNPDAEPSRNIDPARSAEPSPVGINRVVDYSPRQRREIQMDLFARDFLLPRSVVRALHLNEGLTVSQIAERFGAPFDVVAQQLLDALLLPPVASEPKAAVAIHSLNQLQTDAANHRGKAYLLEAGPGTGKTQTLIARVEGLLADGVDPRRILLLTFSNKAAGEMASRIALKNRDAASAMWIGTFHAFGLDLIRRFHVELNLPKNPRLLDRTDSVEFLEQEFPRLNLVHYRNLYDPTQNIADILIAISRAKDEVVTAQQYMTLAQTMLQTGSTPELQKTAQQAIEVARVYQAYEALKQKEGCIDFGDLVLLPVLLLERDAAIRQHFQRLYDHVLVDEYQDVNRSSIRLLQAMCGDGENLWVVGDVKQSIYRFRGASSFNMVRFGKEDFPKGERSRLKQNYRSVGEVVNIFSKFASGMAVSAHDNSLEAMRGCGSSRPELLTVNQSHQQTAAIVDSIETMRSQGYCYRDQAVLCTGNEKLSNIAQELERIGVPILFLGSLFERTEIKDALALLSLLIDQRAMGLVRIACWPEFSMSLADVGQVIDHLRLNEIEGGWQGEIESILNLSETGRTTLASIVKMLEGFNERSLPWTVLATVLLERTRIAAQIADSDHIGDRARGIALWQLMNFIRSQPSNRGLPIMQLLGRVRRLVRLGDDRALRQLPTAAQGLDAVRLMTIHGAKGLEFPVVHLPGLNADTLPRSAPPPRCPQPDGMIERSEDTTAKEIFHTEQVLEQECLFYVALSRSRDRLFLYAPTQKSDGKKRALSPFLDRLGQDLVRQHVTPKCDREHLIFVMSINA